MMTSVFGAHQNHPVTVPKPTKSKLMMMGSREYKIVSCYGSNLHLPVD